jgi:hypothetical protein
MKTMKFIVLLTIGVLSVGSMFAQAPERKKEGNVAVILETAKDISRLASSNESVTGIENPNDNMRQRTYKTVEKINDAEGLVTLALILRAILGSQDAADVDYDRVINVAFWHCVNLISEDTSDEAAVLLRRLWRLSGTDAGDTRLFREAIQHQEAKRRREKKQQRKIRPGQTILKSSNRVKIYS